MRNFYLIFMLVCFMVVWYYLQSRGERTTYHRDVEQTW